MIQDVADRLSLPRPAQVIGSTDPQVQTLLKIANKEGDFLYLDGGNGGWQEMRTIASFQTVASQDEYDLETVAPGWDFQVNPTMWDQTGQNYIKGPITPAEYQTKVSYMVMDIYYEWMVKEDKLVLYPTPESAITVSFFYHTRFWCKSSGGTLQSKWQADTDEGVLNEDLMGYGIEWRYNQARGFPYEADERAYRRMVNARVSSGVTGRAIDITGRDQYDDRRIPWGGWPDY